MSKGETDSRSGEDNISREEALQLLGVKKETLYTYVSRGLIQSFPLNEGRTHLFSRADVERLRAKSLARSGIGAVAETVMRYGEPIITTRITEITPQGPRYRGRLATELADKGCAFESVALLLWTGVWLDDQVSWNDVPSFIPSPSRPSAVDPAEQDTDDFVKLMASTVLALGMHPAEPEQFKLGSTLDAARKIIQVLTGMLGVLSPKRAYAPAHAAEPLAACVMRVLGGQGDAESIAAINAMMVLCADYELTPASFAARVVASSGGDLHASVAAGLCAHSGLLTGQVCDGLAEVLAGGPTQRNLEQRLKEVGRFGASTYGFNPALASKGDPRAYWMIEKAKALAAKKPVAATRNMIAFLDRLRVEYGLYPGLQAGLVTLVSALGLPPTSAAAIWGISRTAGQIAHVMEQREAGFLLRPRATFVNA
ncbi:citrate/2-methylcitrate synthase [soil metagenome]